MSLFNLICTMICQILLIRINVLFVSDLLFGPAVFALFFCFRLELVVIFTSASPECNERIATLDLKCSKKLLQIWTLHLGVA